MIHKTTCSNQYLPEKYADSTCRTVPGASTEFPLASHRIARHSTHNKREGIEKAPGEKFTPTGSFRPSPLHTDDPKPPPSSPSHHDDRNGARTKKRQREQEGVSVLPIVGPKGAGRLKTTRSTGQICGECPGSTTTVNSAQIEPVADDSDDAQRLFFSAEKAQEQ